MLPNEWMEFFSVIDRVGFSLGIMELEEKDNSFKQGKEWYILGTLHPLIALLIFNIVGMSNIFIV